MKICLPFPGDSVGGSHVNAILTMQLLKEHGHEFIVLLHREGPLADWLTSQDVAYEMVPSRSVLPEKGQSLVRNSTRAVFTIPTLARWLRRRDVDIVYANDGRIITTWALPTRLARKKFLVHHHLADMGPFVRRAASLSHRIITISQFNHERLPKHLRSRSTIIPNPVATPTMPRDEARQSLRAMLGLPADTTLIGFVGKIKQQKRPLLFLEAAARLQAEGRHFPMFGGQHDAETYDAVTRRITELELQDVVHLVGFVDDLPNLVGGLDLLLAPQVDEGFGRNVAEAMVAGVPVIASRSGGHLDFIEDGQTGLLVPGDDVDSMTTAARSLVEDFRLASQLAMHGSEYIAEQYSPKHYGKQVDSLFAALA